eukprot:TRINITY_DN5643_c0_g1_i1.p1 TRINITY_DN5643_c0_g1~~TRINITY_DN5643_c0_g1_i1.p1  ORF type:complete len:137 (-),score=16.23 TRINITY_DN5643_c0_g1_i1:45-455(-)
MAKGELSYETKRLVIMIFGIIFIVWGILLITDAAYSNYTGYIFGVLILLLGLFGFFGAYKFRHDLLKLYFIGCMIYLVIIIVNFILFNINNAKLCHYVVGGCERTKGFAGSILLIVMLVVSCMFTYHFRERGFFKL